mgnify:FL=1
MYPFKGVSDYLTEDKNLSKAVLSSAYNKHVPMNINNPDTCEMRIFRSTTNPRRFFANLEFAHSLVNFCNNTSLKKLLVADYISNFCDNEIKKKSKYSNLSGWLLEFGLVSKKGRIYVPNY